MSEFEGRTVVITGAAGALGRTLVDRFASAGANVVVAARHDSAVIAEQAPGEAVGVALDITSETGWGALVHTANERYGGVDILINNAAYLHVGTTQSIDVDQWRKVLDTNVTGTLLGIRAVTPSMRTRGGGAIVNVGSISGLTAAPGLAAYSTSKWALRGLTRNAALDLAPDNIRVNAVVPGIIDTPLAYGPNGEELVPTESFPIPRQAQPGEIAEFIEFAASQRASFATGAELVVDGGFALGTSH
ncbi:SDR family NAD(P)-dependent oxidoreductase [Mycolicibacterium baixiangningiae]|uniref:SDR family NAD(P)-dependent oxidoreductase n=1 Tax=Mycolicibacterium baixiangningiae TaxID=2761578 RepID=UPI0018D028EF|nr:SDR family oxidoreductase [Mycolicibacterium baixiangningiae]